MKCEIDWRAAMKLLETHYQKHDNSLAFETWREIRTFIIKEVQSIDNHTMCFEKYKIKMKWFNIELGERIHGLNLLCCASLTDHESGIAMRKVNNENPNEVYNQAKTSLKKSRFFTRKILYKNEPQKLLNRKKMLRKSPVSNAWAAIIKNADFF